MTDHHLASANVARMRGSYEDPIMADFVGRLDPLNEIADDAPGFIWRYIEGDAEVGANVFGDPLMLFNMSVWASVEALQDYVYRSDHVKAVQKRSDWFEPPTRAPFVLWWVPAGHLPTPVEARDRLQQLWANGPGAGAFTFRRRFGPDGSPLT